MIEVQASARGGQGECGGVVDGACGEARAGRLVGSPVTSLQPAELHWDPSSSLSEGEGGAIPRHLPSRDSARWAAWPGVAWLEAGRRGWSGSPEPRGAEPEQAVHEGGMHSLPHRDHLQALRPPRGHEGLRQGELPPDPPGV